MVLLIIGALVVAQAISLWLFVDERSLAVRAAIGAEAAGRAANVALLIEEAPQELQSSILRAADSPLVRFEIADRPTVDHLDHLDGGAVEGRIRALLGPTDTRDVRIELHETAIETDATSHVEHNPDSMHPVLMHDHLSAIDMTLSIELADGQWLNVDTRFQRPPLQWPFLSTLSFSITAGIILAAVCWFLLNRLTYPLRRISDAAERFGRGEDANPLAEIGPTEVKELATRFNRMQDRLTRFAADRTRIMAALGHDLRSPLTAFRVRAEMVEDEETKTAMISSIEEMQHMVETTLAFARGMAVSEPFETVDLGSFLKHLKNDMLDAFVLSNYVQDIKLRVRPNALRRALRNVVENAIRYGGKADIHFYRDQSAAFIDICDKGPGIPPDDLEEVFEPFFRLERSRSRETGGTGLGLSIARTLLRASGGDITLSNRDEGGIRASITLPLAS
ncbi:MAG: ATP-binding protein [Pseudomonadota bacterium]